MAKDNRIDIEINAKGGPSLKKTTKQTKQQRKELDKLSGSGKKLDKQQSTQYTRQKQGVIQTANSTKNFSKFSGCDANCNPVENFEIWSCVPNVGASIQLFALFNTFISFL